MIVISGISTEISFQENSSGTWALEGYVSIIVSDSIKVEAVGTILKQYESVVQSKINLVKQESLQLGT